MCHLILVRSTKTHSKVKGKVRIISEPWFNKGKKKWICNTHSAFREVSQLQQGLCSEGSPHIHLPTFLAWVTTVPAGHAPPTCALLSTPLLGPCFQVFIPFLAEILIINHIRQKSGKFKGRRPHIHLPLCQKYKVGNGSNPVTFVRPFKTHRGSSSLIHFKQPKQSGLKWSSTGESWQLSPKCQSPAVCRWHHRWCQTPFIKVLSSSVTNLSSAPSEYVKEGHSLPLIMLSLKRCSQGFTLLHTLHSSSLSTEPFDQKAVAELETVTALP